MGAFLLFRSKSILNLKAGKSAFLNLGFSYPVINEFGTYTLWVFKKVKTKVANSFCIGGNSIYSIGTFSYKKLPYQASLEVLLCDFVNNTLDKKLLLGHYFIFIVYNNNITILRDDTFLISAYYDDEGNFLTSSFIAASAIIERISLNNQSITENLVTGGLTGETTIVNEIKRFNRDSEVLFPDIDFVISQPKYQKNSFRTRKQALEFQIAVLEDYFESFKAIADEFGVDTGLTSGYDSRLLLSLIFKYFKNFHVHSHFRNHKSVEWDIAKLISNNFGLKFVSPPVRPVNSLNDEELNSLISNSFKFFDAQIRIHCNWNEEYNTLEYRLKVLGDKGFGFNGIGGEQYRNADRLFLISWKLDKWIKYNHIRRTSGFSFKSKNDENAFIDYFKAKIFKQIGCEFQKSRLNLLDLKKLQNEVFIQSFRGARTSAENKISFFLSPFADYHVSRAAYEITPFLSFSNNFESDLIKSINLKLAGFPSNYGFRFDKNEPFSKYIIPVVLENFFPSWLSWKIKEINKRRRVDYSSEVKPRSLKLYLRFIQNVKDLGLPLDIDKLILRPDSAPLVISMGYFLENFKSQIE